MSNGDSAKAVSFHPALLRRPPMEMLTSRHHSRDFNGSRAEYIFFRQRIVAAVFSLLALSWIPIDWLFLPHEAFGPLLACRLGFSAAFLVLSFWGRRATSIRMARLLLAAFVLIPAALYVASQSILGQAHLSTSPETAAVVSGYGFLPYAMVSVMAIFPLTLLEGLTYALATGFVYVATQYFFHDLFSVRSIGEIWLLGLIAAIAVWVEVAQLGMLLRLYREATQDHLTGLVNRRVVADQLVNEIDRSRTENHPLSVLLFDLDLFKRINDTYGHLAGDAVLRRFAGILRENLPEDATIGRYGGEEFIAVLPQRDTDAARQLAERIRMAAHDSPATGPEGETISFTTSIGVAGLEGADRVDSLLARVDEKLYAAKSGGRDLVAVAE